MDKFLHANLVINYLKSRASKIILMYSGGKDSVALLHMLSPFFEHIYCCFHYFVKDLECIQPYLDHVSNYKNASLIQEIHPATSEYLYLGYYCNPHSEFKRMIKLRDIEAKVRKQTGAEWVVYGYKKSDSVKRNLTLGTYLYQAILDSCNKAYPLALWKKDDVLTYLKMNNLPWFDLKQGRSNGLDLDYNTLKLLQTKYPNDYKKVLAVFPYAEAIIFEKEYGTT